MIGVVCNCNICVNKVNQPFCFCAVAPTNVQNSAIKMWLLTCNSTKRMYKSVIVLQNLGKLRSLGMPEQLCSASVEARVCLGP